MRIGIDASRALRAKRTGTERYALEIIRHLLALPEAARFQWRLYVDEAPPDGFFTQRITANQDIASPEICLLPRQRLWTHRALAREIKRYPPDLLFVPAHVLPFTMTLLPGATHRLPSVVTIHDLGYRYFPQAYSRFQRIYLPLSTRWNAFTASAVIGVSQATADDLQHLYGTLFYGTLGDKLTVIHEAQADPMTAIQGAPVHDEIDAARVRYQLPPCYALYVGTLQPRKNLRRLLFAYAKLYQQQIVWHLVLVGTAGRQADEFHQLAATLGIEDNVHFLGYVTDAELSILYQGAHFLAFPSLFEGFGLPVLEAQAHGVPVMTSNNSSLPEIAGDAALLVDPTDVDAIAGAMLRLSQDEELRQQLIAAGHKNVQRFSWEKAARETLAVFEKVLEGKIGSQKTGR